MTDPRPPASSTRWTTRRLLKWTSDYFQAKGLDSPRLAAELLLAHVLAVPRIRLYTDLDRPASPLERLNFRQLVERAARHEPIQYLTGHAAFYALDFLVDPRVLIPRPCTEILVDHVIQHTRRAPGFVEPLIADIGTGSGCIAVALAKNLPSAHIIATDIDPQILDLARENARRHHVADRIDFRLGPLYQPLAGLQFSFLLANPPYIPDDEWPDVPPNVKNYEPPSALRGGPDGLDVLGPLIDQAHLYLADPGQLVFEIPASRKNLVLQRVAANPHLANAKILPDYDRLPRLLIADHR